jgi:16S rRNA (uracil1498-N3)-methyltransferase
MRDPLRFFVPPGSLLGDRVTISGDVHHHLHNVLRTRLGSVLTLLDGQGRCCEVELEAISKREASARVIRRWRDEERTLPISLIQGMPKADKFDLILQKGTELGVRCFQPIETDNTVPQVNAARMVKRAQRWSRIATEAARQCRRSFLPEVRSVQKLTEVISGETDDLKLVLWEAGSVPLAVALPEKTPTGVTLLVGPEGGFTDQEIKHISGAGFQAVHLGPRILRTETAGLAATAILQYIYGDWRQAPVNEELNQHEEKP